MLLCAGWLLQYMTSANTKLTLYNQGIAGRQSIAPYKLAITSSENQQSLMWIGRDGPLEIRKTTQLDNKGLFITTSVTIKNIGTASVSDIYCKSRCTNIYFCYSNS
jgi:hypothetical protein